MDTADIGALRIPASGKVDIQTRKRSAALSGLMAWVRLCLERRRQRRRLAELPDHLLKDIGVSRREARWEARRPFWK